MTGNEYRAMLQTLDNLSGSGADYEVLFKEAVNIGRTMSHEIELSGVAWNDINTRHLVEVGRLLNGARKAIDLIHEDDEGGAITILEGLLEESK